MVVFYVMPPRARVWWVLVSSLFFYCYKSWNEPVSEQSIWLFAAIGVSYVSAVIMDIIPREGRL